MKKVIALLWICLAVFALVGCAVTNSDSKGSSQSPEFQEQEDPDWQVDMDVRMDTPLVDKNPTVTTIGYLNEGEVPYTEDGANLEIMTGYLKRRMEQSGIQLSKRILEKVCRELGGEYFVYYCGFDWLQYQGFGVLVVNRPGTDVGKTCYVFENNKYKGYIGLWGTVDYESCFREDEGELWLVASRLVHGTGISAEECRWYRLTSLDLACEVQYTSELSKAPYGDVIQVDYAENDVGIEYDGYLPTVVTEWQETIQGGTDGTGFCFTKEGANSYYSIGMTNETYYVKTAVDYSYYLTNYQTEFLELLQNGTAEQRAAVMKFIELVASYGDFDKYEQFGELYQCYTNYKEMAAESINE